MTRHDGTDGQRTDDDDGTDDGTDGRRRTWTGGQRTDDDDGTDNGTDGRTEDDDDDGTRRDGRREDIHLYMIIKFQIEHWDQVSNVTINRPSTLRFRHPQ